ncbi:Hpt domain-containing protein [Marinomonas pollencensis]|uniref:HPt (Histidine-containing phosphotransfer) domain-containing protein n=1 Tax=Marinomonas pollencensis TaxID=491954 RepID=A0A3E0DIN1_9GAMM|nr:Hpt domain-containing protein [Marinomonas pollencensis]REG82570.1 HPt (histidine-containing phosphotransfer) domain-containing protein [Marinomonas pollencensis]
MQDFDIVDYGNRLGNNKMLMTLVAKEFLTEGAGLVEQIMAQAAADDWNAVARTAHRIKGASAEVSGLAMSATAQQLEVVLEKQDIDAAKQVLEQLQKDYVALASALSNSAF